MKGVSVIICCYNSGNKLIPTLNHLAKQTLMPDVPAEIILVDNNCTDESIIIARDCWQSLKAPFPLTIVNQPKPGLNYAREKGMQTAIYEYAVLCDDDNWLCNDYLKKVFSLFEQMPEVALLGGKGDAVFETPAPPWFADLDGFGYAVGSEGRQTGYTDSVYGAGMCLKKSAYFAIIRDEFSFILSDRKGYTLSSGGDTEISIIFKKAGYKIYLDTTLTFKHFLSTDRLRWNYYLKLRKSFGKANAYLLLYSDDASIKESVLLRKRSRSFLSLATFSLLNLKYFLFPSLFKNKNCANFTQLLSMRLTLFTDDKKIRMQGLRLSQKFKNENQLLISADSE